MTSLLTRSILFLLHYLKNLLLFIPPQLLFYISKLHPQILATKMETGLYETSHRRALYNWCSTERISASRGTPYPCSQEALDNCAFGSNKCPYSTRSPDFATIELERFLDPNALTSSTVQGAIFRLQAGLGIHDWKPDLIIKAFNDLDTVFFDGTLSGHTTLNWRCAPWWIEWENSPNGHRGPLAIARFRGHGKAAIELNAWGILLNHPDAKLGMWKVTLHEMVHAYTAVMCGHRPPTRYDQSRGWDDGHGLMFRRLLYAVHERALRYLNIPAIGRQIFDSD